MLAFDGVWNVPEAHTALAPRRRGGPSGITAGSPRRLAEEWERAIGRKGGLPVIPLYVSTRNTCLPTRVVILGVGIGLEPFTGRTALCQTVSRRATWSAYDPLQRHVPASRYRSVLPALQYFCSIPRCRRESCAATPQRDGHAGPRTSGGQFAPIRIDGTRSAGFC